MSRVTPHTNSALHAAVADTQRVAKMAVIRLPMMACSRTGALDLLRKLSQSGCVTSKPLLDGQRDFFFGYLPVQARLLAQLRRRRCRHGSLHGLWTAGVRATSLLEAGVFLSQRRPRHCCRQSMNPIPFVYGRQQIHGTAVNKVACSPHPTSASLPTWEIACRFAGPFGISSSQG